MLEVIATSVLDAQLAEMYGADRIELISGIAEGGVTPSLGLIEKVLQTVRIPVHVMVRPHANHFCYDEADLEVMVRDIRLIRDLGAAGIVMGVLGPDGQINLEALKTLLQEAGPLSVTFHRAFDEVRDQPAALRQLARFPAIKRVLTSGGKRSALDAKHEIAELVRQSRELSVRILAGSGLTVETLDEFISQTGVTEVHMGTGVRRNGQALAPIDPDKLKAAAGIIHSYRHRQS